MTRDQVEFFETSIAPLASDWRTLDLKAVAERGKAGDWVLHCLRGVFEAEEPRRPETDELPRLPDVLVLHECRDVDGLHGFFESLIKGELTIGGEVMDLKRPNTSPPEPSFYVRRHPRQESLTEFGLDFASLVLAGGDPTTPRLLYGEFRTADTSLRGARPPWDGLADLKRNFIGIQGERALRADYSSIEIVAPVGASLDESTAIADTELRVVTKARNGVALDQLKISVVARLLDGRKYRTQSGFAPQSSGAGLGVSTTVRLPGAPSRATILLQYRGFDADRLELFGRPAASSGSRLAALQKISGGVETLIKGMEGARVRGRELEGWIALLFHVLGFSPGHYGSTPWEAPDILAFPDSQDWFLVVECTEREPDLGGKLTKLSTRTKELEQACAARACPVLVTALERSLVNRTDLEKASKESIAVVTSSEFGDVAQLAIEGRSPMEVRTFLERLIPSEGSGLMHPHWPR